MFPSWKEACGRVASSCWWSTARVAARAGSGATRLCEEVPTGSVKRWAGELGGQMAQEERRRGS
jgi:hypothetical protein